jgi:hypothetical protein
MAKVWVLDTSTKGTGASVVPLDSTREKPDGAPKPPRKAVKRAARERKKPVAPREPRRFKVVDLMSSQTLAEDADMRTTLDVMREVHSPVDVRIFVWDRERDRWHLLTLPEQRALWDAGHAEAPAPVSD